MTLGALAAIHAGRADFSLDHVGLKAAFERVFWGLLALLCLKLAFN